MLNPSEAEPGGAAASPLGTRLRAERQRQGLSLRTLAAAVGVSASMISQLETGRSRPSVSTLYAITSRLGITMEELFEPLHPAEGLVPVAEPPVGSGVPLDPAELAAAADRAAPAGAAGAPGLAGALADPPSPARERPGRAGPLTAGVVVRPDERQTITMDTGVTWERLGEVAGHAVDFLMITYPPGATSSSTGGQMRHSGVEYGVVLRGELILTLGFDEVRLHPGDAVSFPSTTPHGYRNEGAEPAVGVWFVIER